MYSQNEYNPYFNENEKTSASSGLSDASTTFINNIPATAYPYITSMNQYVNTTATPSYLGLITGSLGLADGSNPAPSLYFKNHPTIGMYLMTSNTPTFNTQISSNGYKITSDTFPTILGYGISSTLQSGDTIIGQSAGSVMTGNNNTALGVKALNLATAGDSNTACGWLALGRLVTDGYNTALGSLSLQTLTSGVSNIGLGYNSGLSVQSGIGSIFIGAYSGMLTGSDCNDGVCIGGSSKIVSNSIAIGFESAASTECVALGYRALKLGTNIGNTALGNLALTLNTTGYYNTGIGYSALGSLVDGFQNTGVGSNVFPALTTGKENSAVGDSSGGTVQTGSYNTFLGTGSQSTGTDTHHGLCLGYSTQTDSYGIAIGAGAIAPANGCVLGSADILTTRLYGKVGINQAPGTAALEVSGDTIHYGIINGYNTLPVNDHTLALLLLNPSLANNKSHSIKIGKALSAKNVVDISYNHVSDGSNSNGLVFQINSVGPILGFDSITTKVYKGLEVAGKVGINQAPDASAQFAVSGSMLLGSSSVLLDPANGLYNIQYPGGTGTKMISGVSVYNTAHGYRTFNPHTQTGKYNTVVGYQAMGATDPSVDTVGNTGIGAGALGSVSGGSKNTALGQNSGNAITTGTNNTIIGHSSNVGGATDTNSVVVGYNVTGAGSNTTVIGNANTIATTIYGDINLVFLDYSSGTSTQSNSVGVDFAVQFGTLVSSKNITGKIDISGTGNTFFKNTSGKTVYWLVSYHVSMTTGSTLPVNLKTWITVTSDTATLNGNYLGHNSHVGNLFDSTSYTLKNSGCAIVEVPNNSYVIIVANEYSTGGAISVGGSTSDLYNRISIKQLG
jgi:trimeric autotransporter adhesin